MYKQGRQPKKLGHQRLEYELLIEDTLEEKVDGLIDENLQQLGEKTGTCVLRWRKRVFQITGPTKRVEEVRDKVKEIVVDGRLR